MSPCAGQWNAHLGMREMHLSKTFTRVFRALPKEFLVAFIRIPWSSLLFFLPPLSFNSCFFSFRIFGVLIRSSFPFNENTVEMLMYCVSSRGVFRASDSTSMERSVNSKINLKSRRLIEKN